MIAHVHRSSLRTTRLSLAIGVAVACVLLKPAAAAASDEVYFSATTNITNILVKKIHDETERIDMSAWYLSEHALSIALVDRFKAGVQVRLLGDRGSIFETDPNTRKEFYWLASQGIPIRLRYNPNWYPEIDHWKASIFSAQNVVEFGSANYTPFELAPESPTNYKDEVVMFTDDSSLVNAFRTRFDQMWNDTTVEPNSRIRNPPFFKNWDDACALESVCADYSVLYPPAERVPMVIDTRRLELDYPTPADLIWGQGPLFNDRLVDEINREPTKVDLVAYRLTVQSVADALISKFQAHVPVRFIVDPEQYTNHLWPEYWLTHAYTDKIWAAGVAVKQRLHVGLTHMKLLVTSLYATNASSNIAANWQRDHDYFVSAATKPAIYQAMKDRFEIMWNDASAFEDFHPLPADPADLVQPASSATNVATTPTFVWNTAAFAVSYDVLMGPTQSNMSVVGRVAAELVQDPPLTYSWTPSAPLQSGTIYYWRVVSRTYATDVDSTIVANSEIRGFTTAGSSGPPAAPGSPNPANGATGVATAMAISWTAAGATSYDISFGTTNPPPQVSANQAAASYTPPTLTPGVTYFWRIVARNSAGATTGPVWSFVTASGPPPPPADDIVIYANDVPASSLHGWTKTSDATAAAGFKLTTPDDGVAHADNPLAAPTQYFDVTFPANAGTQYRIWLRLKALNNSKFNDAVWVQFSDATAGGSAIYPLNSGSGLLVNLATDSTATSLSQWGWQNSAYWLSQTTAVSFAASGTHTMRIQIREDGVQLDQIVLSPTTYFNAAPGPVSNDTTIVPKPVPPGPPAAPNSPNPSNGATGASVSTTLSWSAAGATSFDVRFGTTNPPPVVSSAQAAASYTPATLTAGATYFWQIVARNGAGTTTGPVWSFTTAAAPPPPGTPGSPSPANAATGVSLTPTLTWSASNATSFDVRFGTTNPPPVVSSAQAAASYTPATLTAGATYFWQIVARNGAGTTTGPVWSFTTAAAPPPPGTPGSPSPANAATGVSLTPTLTWSASNATSFDVRFGTTNPPPLVSSAQAAASYTPATLTAGATHFWQIVARDGAGTTTGPVWSFTTATSTGAAEIVIYGNDVSAANLHGGWTKVSDATAAGGIKLITPDSGAANTEAPVAAPAEYFDVTFSANAGTPYRIWLRLQALNNNKFNDAVWVQFSDARSGSSPIYPLNSSSGLMVNLATDSTATSLNRWGWQNSAYWLSQATTVTFATSGTHTMRVQIREDGVQLDQIVLSPSTYLTAAPGPVTNDATIVPKAP